MDVFFKAFQIMAGILSPFVLIFLIIHIASVVRDLTDAFCESKRKQPPYDDVIVGIDFFNGSYDVQLVKKGKVIWKKNIPYNKKSR